MTRRPTIRRRRNRFGVRTWWDAVSGGAFFSRATAYVSLVVCATALAPFHKQASAEDLLPVLVVGVLTWIPLGLLGLAAGGAERALRTRGARAAVVLSALVIGGASRPLLNEFTWAVLHGIPTAPVAPMRLASNIIILTAAGSIVAITTRSLRANARSRARLDAALKALADARGKLRRFARDNHERMDGIVSTLREQRDEMLSRPLDFPAVRGYSDHVRRISHHLEDRSQLDLRLVVAEDDRGEKVDRRERIPLLARLQPTPYGLVGAVFLLCCLPYLCSLTSLPRVLGAVALAVPVILVADAVAHAASAALEGVFRGLALIGIWMAVGAAVTITTHTAVGTTGPVLTLPVVSLPAIALACAACVDAIERAARDAEHLEAVLGLVAQSLTHEASRARGPLRAAAHLLHGRVQGRCVILAAAADERPPTDEELEVFRRETDEAFQAIVAGFDGDAVVASQEDIHELLATWGSVLHIDTHIDPTVEAALEDPEVSARVVTIVNEGFVNAVKHSVVTRVGLAIDPVGPDALRVQTWSTGVLDLSGADAGRGVESLGEHATLTQCGDEVVLEVIVPLQAPAPDTSTSAVTVVSGCAEWRGFLAPRVG